MKSDTRREVLTEAGEDKRPHNDDERLKRIGVHESGQATCSHIHINLSEIIFMT